MDFVIEGQWTESLNIESELIVLRSNHSTTTMSA